MRPIRGARKYRRHYGSVEKTQPRNPAGFRGSRVPLAVIRAVTPGLPLIDRYGTVCGGLATSRWFIENGRAHAALIAAHAAGAPAPTVALHGQE